MSSKGKKRGGHDVHENHERWLLTYADMITLLVAFFIMMYAMSIVSKTKFQQLAVSVRSGFGGSMTNGSPTIINVGGGINGTPAIVTNTNGPKDSNNVNTSKVEFPVSTKGMAASREKKAMEDVYKTLKAYIDKKGLAKSVIITNTERGIIIALLTDKMLFDKGKSDIRVQEYSILDTIAHVISNSRNIRENMIRIEGHTDNLPIHTTKFEDNWDLSAIRATTVLRYFVKKGVDSYRLTAVAYGEENPAHSNDSEDGRRLNRRVDIVIMRRY